MDRRTFIASSGAAAFAASLPAAILAQPVGSGDTALNALFERIFNEAVQRSPELATSLGLDKGPNAALKGKLSPRTLAERRRQLAQVKQALADLEAVDASTLSPAAKLNREIVIYSLTNQTIAPQRFGLDSVIRPYRIFQQGGAYFSVPDFLNTAHTIATKDDAEAYLSRLEAFAVALDEDSAMQRIEADRLYLAPAWSLDLTLGQMEKLRGQKAEDCSQ